MENINKNIIMQAGAAVANATNKAAGLSAATPEPGSIISAVQLVNGGRTIGPDALAHFTESVRNKLLSLLVSMEPVQSGTGEPSPDNVRPIIGRTGADVYVSPTSNVAEATTYSVDWTSEAGTVYGGTLDMVTGVLTVDYNIVDMGVLDWSYLAPAPDYPYGLLYAIVGMKKPGETNLLCSTYPLSTQYYHVDKSCFGNERYGTVYVIDSTYSDATVFKKAISGKQMCYERATPLTYQLTTQDIITLVGDNYIWSDSGDVTITE